MSVLTLIAMKITLVGPNIRQSERVPNFPIQILFKKLAHLLFFIQYSENVALFSLFLFFHFLLIFNLLSVCLSKYSYTYIV